jgi:pimeloyl-ACP methyl ester carboxylesterase
MDLTCQQYVLGAGRRLGFAEYGDPSGFPLFYFHGWPSSRIEARLADRVASELRLRLIAPERPGYGLSDFLPRRTIGDWPGDVSELANHLRLERFGVLGISGGGPYAAACAALIPERLTDVLMVCSLGPSEAPGALDGMVPLNRWLLSFAQTTPWVAQKTAAACMRAIWGNGEQVIPRQIEERLPTPDKETLKHPELRETLIASSKESLRRGTTAAAWEGFLFSRPWDFQLQDIRVPVHLWHGEQDIIVPPTMGAYLAKTIPGCMARFYPGEGHFSLPFTRMREILGALRR